MSNNLHAFGIICNRHVETWQSLNGLLVYGPNGLPSQIFKLFLYFLVIYLIIFLFVSR